MGVGRRVFSKWIVVVRVRGRGRERGRMCDGLVGGSVMGR